MKAFQLRSTGAPPSLQVIPKPTPRSGEIRVKIAACGLNFADLLMIDGRYQETPAPPFTLGMEVAGTIESLSEDVAGLAAGERVAVFAGQGGLAEYGTFPAARCVRLPDSMSFKDAAAFQVAYGTSHLALAGQANLKSGEVLVVLGAAGGVGLTAVEIGKAMGATVIAVARGEAKLDVAKQAGADHVLDSETTDLKAEIKGLGGADVVYDPVGGGQFDSVLRACNPLARIVVIGFASGDIPQIPANIIMVKNITVIGFYWGGYLSFAPKLLTESLETLFAMYGRGKLRPHISHVLPLDRAQEALALLKERRSMGKVVVRPEK